MSAPGTMAVVVAVLCFPLLTASSSSSSSSPVCPAAYAEKHKEIDAKIGSESALIKGASSFQFGNESKEVGTMV